MSGTLRSLADNILFHRKKLTRSFQLHVIVLMIQVDNVSFLLSYRRYSACICIYINILSIYHRMHELHAYNVSMRGVYTPYKSYIMYISMYVYKSR